MCREGLRAGDLETIEIWHGTSEGEPDEGAASKRIDEAVPRTVEQIEHWLVARMAGLLKVSMDEIEPGEPFARYGLESIDAAELAIAIVDRWTLELPPTVFWDYPSVGELARFIAEQAAPQANEPSSEPAPTGAEPV